MAVNKVLINQVLDHLRENPQEWDQDLWFCQTTACFGGRALLMSGYRMIDPSVEKVSDTDAWSHLSDLEMVDPSGDIVRDYSLHAAQVLGLPKILAGGIFGCMLVDFDEFEAVVRTAIEEAGRADGHVSE